VIAALVAIVAIGFTDAMTGPDIGFALFYLVPIVGTAWSLGPWPGIIAAAAASAAWFAAELALLVPAPPRPLAVMLWNGVTRVAIFTAIAYLVSAARRDRDRLRELTERLAELLRRETDLARTDPVTGLPNSRYFLEVMTAELAQAKRASTRLTLAYVDVDNFKKVNDRFGHAAGDDLLRSLSTALRETIRAGDLAGRLAGDEFALMLVGVDGQGAEVVANRCLERVRQIALAYPGCDVGLSIGIAAATPDSDTQSLIARADRAMYAAKASGKGRVAGA